MDALLILPENRIPSGYYPVRYWLRNIAISLTFPTAMILITFFAHQSTWQTTFLPALSTAGWLYLSYVIVWVMWMRHLARRHAFFAAAEEVRQSAAAQDDILTDSYRPPTKAAELLPITITSHARPSAVIGMLSLPFLTVTPYVYAIYNVPSAEPFSLENLLFPIAFGGFFLVLFFIIGRDDLNNTRTVVTADYAGLTIRHRFTRQFMPWSEARLFYAPLFTTTPMELEGKLMWRLRYLRDTNDATLNEAIQLEQCQLANADRVFTFTALRDEQHVPHHPDDYPEQVQRLMTAIMQQTSLPLRMPSAEGVRFVAESLPFTSQWFKEQLDEDDPAHEDDDLLA